MLPLCAPSGSPDANRATLLRRLYLDLVGLPPRPDETDGFLEDARPGAFERVVDRLLASPRFGERWARHWLDVVGYADTVGFDMNDDDIHLADGKWRYRDYVIDAFNADKPYDVFIRQQLAGDEAVPWRRAETFTPEIQEHLVATGYLRTAQDFSHETISDIPANHYAVLHDTVEILGASLFSLTLKCARCHDHKFDPVLQEDYYRLMACLTPAYNSKRWRAVSSYRPLVKDRTLPFAGMKERDDIERENASITQRLRQLDKKRVELEKERVKNSDKLKEVNTEARALADKRRSWDKIQALFDVGPAPLTHLLVRGDYAVPGREVDPGGLSALSNAASDRLFGEKPRDPETSGRRTALARWATRSGTPAAALVARVMVNRTWQHLFGEGIVTSTGNFGVHGEPPTHPALLEWLAANFQRDDWHLKSLIRTLVTSTVYRQASSSTANEATARQTADEFDPGNRLLWRTRLRRLDAEVIRDSLVAIGGNLNTAMGGPAILSAAQTDGRVTVDQKKALQPEQKWRRSVYLLTRRAYNLSLLSTFDQPAIGTTCSRRQPSAVVSQSLAMQNDAFLFEQAEHFARRVVKIVGPDLEAQVEAAFRIALTRRPSQKERSWCAELLARQSEIYQREEGATGPDGQRALVELCHTLLNTSELLYAE